MVDVACPPWGTDVVGGSAGCPPIGFGLEGRSELPAELAGASWPEVDAGNDIESVLTAGAVDGF